MKITDERGSIFEYSEDNGLISKDGVIVSGAEYEPVFAEDKEGKPVLCGILLNSERKFISLSGKISKLS